MTSKRKVPIILISGFLGSGKTSLIAELLDGVFADRKIAVVQNEFASSSIDSTILQESGRNFILRELNTGSIFCTCLFSHFKEVIVELSQTSQPDCIIVEATGIADPIGIAGLLEDERVADRCYLWQIVTLVDATRFLRGVHLITEARHQVQVADVALISKVDLVDDATHAQVRELVEQINPTAKIIDRGTDTLDIICKPNIMTTKQHSKGELTHCGDGGYVSKIFKSARPIKRANLDIFLASLTTDILRLKGYIRIDDSTILRVQYTPGYLSIEEVNNKIIGNTELIAIGYREPQFALLQIDNNLKFNPRS